MKSIKTNPNSAKGPNKGKIVNKVYRILLTTLELTWLYFFSKKTDKKFIILVSNLKEISPRVFSWKKKNIYKTTMQFCCQNTIRPKKRYYGFFTGFKKIKQRRISFILGYLRMILWKISTAIGIKHRILATFNIKKNSILTACMPLIEMLVSFFLNERISINKFFTSDFGDLFYRSNPFNHSEHNYRQYVFNKSGFKIQLKSD